MLVGGDPDGESFRAGHVIDDRGRQPKFDVAGHVLGPMPIVPNVDDVVDAHRCWSTSSKKQVKIRSGPLRIGMNRSSPEGI